MVAGVMHVPSHRRSSWEAVSAPLVALLAYVALHRNGIGMISDSWALWQGAISLTTGHGYTYFSGHPIVAWPPLYSAWLALWVLALGTAGWVLVLANGVLLVLQAHFWTRLAETIEQDCGLAPSRLQRLLLALFVGSFIAVHQRFPFGQSLVYVLLPPFLGAVWKMTAQRTRGLEARTVMLAVLLLLTHTSSAAFLAAGAILIAASDVRSPRRLIIAALVLLLPIATWTIVRAVLGQAGSHCIGPGVGRYDVLTYLQQAFDGPGKLLVFDRLGAQYFAIAALWIAVVALARGGASAAGLRFAALFGAIALAALFAIFNLTWIYAALGGRFVLFLPLLLVPQLYAVASAKVPRAASTVLVLLLVPQLWWLAGWTAEHGQWNEASVGAPAEFLPHGAHISRGYLSGPPVRQDGKPVMAPNPYEEPVGRCR